MSRTAVLLLDCPDAKGIVASVSTFLYMHGANILGSDQHQDNQAGLFFMRVEFDLADFTLDATDFARDFQPIDWLRQHNVEHQQICLLPFDGGEIARGISLDDMYAAIF